VSVAANYSAREVAWLLSMSYKDALACDTAPADSWPDLLSGDAQLGHAIDPSEQTGLPVVLRWHDVQEARGHVQSEIDRDVVELRRAGYTQAEIGERLGRSQQTVSRHLRATVEEIARALAEPSD